MSITRHRLTQIINEEITRAVRLREMDDDNPLADVTTGEDPIAAARGKWDRLQGLEKKYARYAGMGGGIAVAMRYGDKIDTLGQMAELVITMEGADPAELAANPDGRMAQNLYDKWSRQVHKAFEIQKPRDPRFPYAPTQYSYGINTHSLHAFWNAYLNAGCDLRTLKDDGAAMQELYAEFETADVSDMTDSMYGRKSYVTRHKGTGAAMGPSWRDREGSLGS